MKLLILLLLMITSAFAQKYGITDLSGKTTLMTLTKADDSTVTGRIEGGAIVTLPVAGLNAYSKSVIEAWQSFQTSVGDELLVIDVDIKRSRIKDGVRTVTPIFTVRNGDYNSRSNPARIDLYLAFEKLYGIENRRADSGDPREAGWITTAASAAGFARVKIVIPEIRAAGKVEVEGAPVEYNGAVITRQRNSTGGGGGSSKKENTGYEGYALAVYNSAGEETDRQASATKYFEAMGLKELE